MATESEVRDVLAMLYLSDIVKTDMLIYIDDKSREYKVADFNSAYSSDDFIDALKKSGDIEE